MTGNATHRFTNTAVLTVQTADASRVVTSAAFDERLGDAYARVGLRPGLLQRLAGIQERRWWADGVVLRRRCGHGRRQGDQRERRRPRRHRPDGQHLGQPQAPRAVDGGRRPRRARAAALVPELRRHQRVPRLRQRHGARRRDDRQRAWSTTPSSSTARTRARCRSARSTGSTGRTRLVKRRDGRVRHPDPGLGGRRDGARPRRPAPRGPPAGRRRSAARAPSTTSCASGDNDGMRPTSRVCWPPAWTCPPSSGPTRPPSSTGRRGWTATSSTRSPRCTPRPSASGSASTRRGCPAPSRPSATSGRLGAVHAGRPGRHAGRRRPGAADGDRLGPQRLLPRDHLVTAAPPTPRRTTSPAGPAPGRARSPSSRRDGRPRTWHLLDNGRGARLGTLLCVHGNPTWSYLWRRLLAAAPPGWRVVAPDQLGMGLSERLTRAADPGAAGRRPRRPHRAPWASTGRWSPSAHDWGGIISLGWALEHPSSCAASSSPTRPWPSRRATRARR